MEMDLPFIYVNDNRNIIKNNSNNIYIYLKDIHLKWNKNMQEYFIKFTCTMNHNFLLHLFSSIFTIPKLF